MKQHSTTPLWPADVPIRAVSTMVHKQQVHHRSYTKDTRMNEVYIYVTDETTNLRLRRSFKLIGTFAQKLQCMKCIKVA